ncbi:MAG: hypothetical protein DRJ42_04845 [Deltaproteobacteria bacterium]|nr:MAG: hypothetical protein DRJ42_04845 [Deltaproteobacteria bacterium]
MPHALAPIPATSALPRLTPFVLLVLLAACGGADQPPPGTLLHADMNQTPERVVEEEPGPDGLILRMLSFGDEDGRRELRYERREGTTEDGRIQMMMSVAIPGADGRQGGHQTAPISLDIEAGPTEAAGDGLWRYHLRVTGLQVGLPPETPQEVLEHFATETAPLRALASTVVIDDRGIVHERAGEIPEGLEPRTLALLANIRMSLLSPVLPGAAIGEGATWEVKHLEDHGDFEVHQIVSYELVSLERHTGRLQVTLRQHAPPGPIGGREEDGGGEARGELISYETLGGGYVEFDLRHIIPEAQIAGRTHVEAVIETPAARIPTQSEMSIAIRVEPSR